MEYGSSPVEAAAHQMRNLRCPTSAHSVRALSREVREVRGNHVEELDQLLAALVGLEVLEIFLRTLQTQGTEALGHAGTDQRLLAFPEHDSRAIVGEIAKASEERIPH